MSPLTLGIIGICLLLTLIALGVHVGLALLVSGSVGIIVASGFDISLAVLRTTPLWTVFNYELIAIPLFVLMGSFVFYAGIGEDLFSAVYKLAGKIPGSIAVSVVTAATFFGAASGSNLSTVTVFTKVGLPAMVKEKYDPKFAMGAIVSSSMASVFIPPSILLVLYGVMAEQSIARCLLAGILPGILIGAALAVFVIIRVKIRPALAPISYKSFTWKERIFSMRDAWMIVLLAVAVLGGMYSGLFTPTEAAGVGACLALVIPFVRRRLHWRDVLTSLRETAQFSAVLFFILIGAFVFARFLALSGVTTSLANLILEANLNSVVLIIALMGLFMLLGLFMDAISIMAIILPILAPAMQSLGYDMVWFGIFMLFGLQIGAFTPPFGLGVFAARGALTMEMKTEDIFKGCVPFMVVCIAVWAFLAFSPEFCLWLPNAMR